MRVRMVRAPDEQRRGLTWRQALTSAVLLSILLGLVAAALATISPPTNPASASILPAQPGALAWNGRDPLTILLLGSDGHPPGHGATSGLVVASYDPVRQSLSLIAIPSTLWVTIPGFGPAPISQAAADGGPSLALETVQSVTHLVIPWYAMVGSDTTRRLVNALDTLAQKRRKFTGPDVLHYLNVSSEGVRGEREIGVILALDKMILQPQNLFQIPTILNGVADGIMTNLPFNQVPTLAHAMMNLPRSHIHALSLGSAAGAVAPYKSAGQHVLLPNWGRIGALAHRMVRREHVGGHIRVLNGAGILGAAGSLTAWLHGFGIPIHAFGSASSFSYPHTEVVLGRHVSQTEMRAARAVASLLQVPLVQHQVPGSRDPVTVIIGADYQDPAQQ